MEQSQTLIEEWRPVVGFEKYYEVSNLGRIKSLCRIIYNRGHKIIRKERFLKLHKSDKGYFRIKINVGDYVKTVLVHRLVAEAFVPNPENKPHVNHMNSTPTDNRVENLEWCTHAENMKHSYVNGRREHLDFRGEKSPVAKLNWRNVRKIRKMYGKNGYTSRSLGKKFGVDQAMILNIVHNRNWIE